MAKKKADAPLENDGEGVATELVSVDINDTEHEMKNTNYEVIENNEAGVARELSEEDHSSSKAELEEPKVPKMEDIDWTDWVLSQFEPDELDNGYPKANGLRRLVRVVQGEKPYTMKFADVADAYIDNIKGDMFVVFPTANASTRAEVRALRKMLNIGVAAAEELPDLNFTSSAAGEIPNSLITKIDIKCAVLNVNVMKFVNKGRGRPGQPELYTDIKEVPFAVGQRLFSELNVFQQRISAGEKKEDVVPERFQPYNPNWRSND
jgi:hypothetical protein